MAKSKKVENVIRRKISDRLLVECVLEYDGGPLGTVRTERIILAISGSTLSDSFSALLNRYARLAAVRNNDGKSPRVRGMTIIGTIAN